MAKITILTVKKNLAAAFPGVAFTYGIAGRSRDRGHAASWIGGPPAEMVRAASGVPLFQYSGRMPYHFHRQMCICERDAYDAAEEAGRPAREAAAAAAKLARKAHGKIKGVETRRRNAADKAKLTATFPGVPFTLSDRYVAWIDGPLRDTVAMVLGWESYLCHRLVTVEWLKTEAERTAAEMIVKRLARRLTQSKVRAIRVARGIARRERLPEAQQLWLPFGPSIVAFNAHVMAAGVMHA